MRHTTGHPQPEPGGPRLPRWVHDFIAHGAPEGERNARLYAAAQQCFAAGMPLANAEFDLIPAAVRCGLGRAEAAAAIKSAFKSTMVTEPIRSAGPQRSTAPLPAGDDFLRMFAAAFEPGELVCLTEARWHEDIGEWKPSKNHIKTREEWESQHRRVGIERAMGSKGGCFIGINPMLNRQDGRRISNIAAFRHVLAEFDGGSLTDQRKRLETCGLPISVMVGSGRRSVHGWVRVDARDRAEWEARRDHVFKTLGCDPKNKDLARVSRLAGVTREVDGRKCRQELLAVNLGPRGWPGGDTLPEILPVERFMADPLAPPEPVVKGLLYPGCKMVLGASSKGRKSWALLDLALSCALGVAWLGMPVTQGNALYINFELKPWMLKQRLQAIAEDRGLSLATAGRLEVWNLRGHAASFSTLVPMMIARIHRLRRPYSLIVMDPLYKGLGDADENAAGDINRLMNELERLCDETSAALAIAHHFAKGDPWEKEPMDRLSGSGVFGREPDSLLVLTGGRLPRNVQDQREGVVPKADKDTLIFADAILRASPPIPQFRLRWQRYHFRREDGKVTTYRLGSYASKYGQTLAGMPRLVRKSDAAECEVCGWIAEKCTVARDEAAKIFDNLRKDCYGLLAFEGEGVWVGTDYLENNPF